MGYRRTVAQWVERRLGVTLVPRSRRHQWPEDRFLTGLLDRLAIDCVFDVGANVGQYASELRYLGYVGTILSFEPAPAAAEQLARTASADPHWHVFPHALGREPGTLPFNIMRDSTLNSFRQPVPDRGQAFADKNVVTATITVEVRTLDDCFAELQQRFGFARPFLKMDTQGFDLEVIAGGSRVLPHFLGMSSEVAVKMLYEEGVSVSRGVQHFSELGFDLVGLYPVHPANLLDPHEFNCYVLRRDLAG